MTGKLNWSWLNEKNYSLVRRKLNGWSTGIHSVKPFASINMEEYVIYKLFYLLNGKAKVNKILNLLCRYVLHLQYEKLQKD